MEFNVHYLLESLVDRNDISNISNITNNITKCLKTSNAGPLLITVQ